MESHETSIKENNSRENKQLQLLGSIVCSMNAIDGLLKKAYDNSVCTSDDRQHIAQAGYYLWNASTCVLSAIEAHKKIKPEEEKVEVAT